MDLQRSLLIGAIAVLSFMLLTEWVAFKDARTAITEQETTRLISNGDNGFPAATPDLSDAPAASGAGVTDSDEDLPPVAESTAAGEDTPALGAADAGNIIQVHTDVLQLAIDLNGGDIVELALPKYLAQIDDPDVPFVLLEQAPSQVKTRTLEWR